MTIDWRLYPDVRDVHDNYVPIYDVDPDFPPIDGDLTPAQARTLVLHLEHDCAGWDVNDTDAVSDACREQLPRLRAFVAEDAGMPMSISYLAAVGGIQDLVDNLLENAQLTDEEYDAYCGVLEILVNRIDEIGPADAVPSDRFYDSKGGAHE